LPFSKIQEEATREPASRKIRAPSSEPSGNNPSLIDKPDRERPPITLKTRPEFCAEIAVLEALPSAE
jgi:hypothetical protein